MADECDLEEKYPVGVWKLVFFLFFFLMRCRCASLSCKYLVGVC